MKIRLDRIEKEDRTTVIPVYVKQKYVAREFYNGTYDIMKNGTIIASKSECGELVYKHCKSEEEALDWCIRMEYEIVK